MGPAGVDLSLGCIFIGVVLNVWLYGFSCVQVYIYFLRFKADKAWLRSFVALLFLLDTLNTVLDLHFLYDYLISHFGMLEYSAFANSTFAADPFLVSAIGLMTQLFFAWRVYRLTPGRWAWVVPTIIALTGIMSTSGATWTTIEVTKVKEFAKFQSFQVAVILWLAGAAISDTIVTTSLILTLKRSKTGFSQTDDVITRLIRATLQTGVLTASFAIIDLILFLASTTTLHLIFNLPLSKLYVNSLLATLNARAFATNNGTARYLSSASSGNNHNSTKKTRHNSHYYLRQAEDGQAQRGLQTKESFNTADERRSSDRHRLAGTNGQPVFHSDVESNAGKKVRTTKNFFASKIGVGAFKGNRKEEIEMPHHRDQQTTSADNGIHVLTIHDRYEEDDPYTTPPPSAKEAGQTTSRPTNGPSQPSSTSVSSAGKAAHQDDDEEMMVHALARGTDTPALEAPREQTLTSQSSNRTDESLPMHRSGPSVVSPARRLSMAIEQGNPPPHPYTSGF